MKINFKNQSGMSLVEIVIVMAIVSVLIAVAVPSYKNYQARARRAEAMNMLSGYFTAAKTAQGEFGRFPGNLVQTGWAPSGSVNYRFHNNNNPGMTASTRIFDFNCQGTADACNCAGGGSAPCPNFKTWTENIAPTEGIGAVPTGPWESTACGSLSPTTVSSDTRFSARVAGRIRIGGVEDVWGINEMREIQNCQDGSIQ